MQKAMLIFNPKAGRFDPEPLINKAAGIFREHGWSVEISPTQSGEHVTELARKAGKDNLDALIVAGGDGSINRAAAGLQGSKTALGILPTGTANVLAKELNFPGLNWYRPNDLDIISKALANGQVQTFDVGTLNGRTFLLWAGLGIDGIVVNIQENRRSRWKKFFAFADYGLTIIQQSAGWKGMQLQVKTDKLEISGNYMLALISNIRLYAGGISKISPTAQLNDGKMDLWLLGGQGVTAILRHLWHISRGTHINAPDITYIQFNSLALNADYPEHLQLDGEPLGKFQNLNISVEHNALNVIIPNLTPKDLFINHTD